jgi:methyl coenzyme M reductase beta subunit
VVENAEESAEEVKDSAPVSDDDDVAKKTNKSEHARAKKRD